MKLSGIILAAGASVRMGRPKALLTYRGRTFLDTVRSLLEPHCEEVLVVGAPDSKFPTDIVNPEPGRGMLSSLQCALASVPRDRRGFLFTPVDIPAILPSTIEMMLAAWNCEPFCIPRAAGRRGHPVLASIATIQEFLDETQTPKHVIDLHATSILYVDVADPGILLDTDTPADYARLVSIG